jgi:hypothetical protein
MLSFDRYILGFIWFIVGVTGQQCMPNPPKHLILILAHPKLPVFPIVWFVIKAISKQNLFRNSFKKKYNVHFYMILRNFVEYLCSSFIHGHQVVNYIVSI